MSKFFIATVFVKLHFNRPPNSRLERALCMLYHSLMNTYSAKLIPVMTAVALEAVASAAAAALVALPPAVSSPLASNPATAP